MAVVVDRRWKKGPRGTRIPTGYEGPSPWQVRWRDPDRQQRTKAFRRKVDADQFATGIEHRMLTGEYVDPNAGKVRLKAYAEQWRSRQLHRPNTQISVEHRLRLHVYPHLGQREIRSVLPSDVQALVTELSMSLAPLTVTNIYRNLSAIFKDAARDRIIGRSPCEGVKLPKRQKKEIVPPTIEAVEAIADAIDERYRVAVILAAGSGLRLGEALGLETGHIDFPRRTIQVSQQLLTEKGGTRLGPPKTDSSYRTIYVADAVLTEVSEHIRRFPPINDRVLSNRPGDPVRSNGFQKSFGRATKRAEAADVDFHHLRHFFASALIAGGCSVVAVQKALGHANATETLGTYGHLWPTDEDTTRAAMQAVLSQEPCATDVQRQRTDLG